MKTSIKKTLSFALVICMLFACVIIPNQAIKASAADYVETEFGDGKKVLITTKWNDSSYYLSATEKNSKGAPLAKEFSDKSEIDTAHLWTITAVGSNYYIQDSSGSYLYSTNDNNGLRVGTPKEETQWIYDASTESFQASNTKRYLGIYNGTDWRSYTATNSSNYKESAAGNFTFYEISASSPSVSVSGDNVLTIGNQTTLSAELANTSGDVVWSSNNTDVATVEGGVVTAKAVGKATITAAVNGTTGTMDIIVYPAANSEITIAEALKVCELTGTSNSPFAYSVIGIVESIDTAYDSGYKNITVTIGDGTNSIKAFRMTGGSDLEVGSQIMVTGNLVNYNGNTPEFAEKCTYTVVTDENIEAVRAAIKEIAAKMSLAYKYEATVENVELPSVVEVEDTLNRAFTGVAQGTTYGTWTGKTGTSGAVYAGNNAGDSNTIQLRTNNNNSGIVSTKSGGKIKSITVTWNTSKTTDGRTLDIYASNSAYTQATDLYGSKAGTKVTSFKYTKDTTTTSTYTFTDDYAYIGIRSSNSALYLNSISITWESEIEGGGETVEQVVYSNSEFAFRFGVDASIANIEGVEAYGIKVTAGDKEVFYTENSVKVWGNDGEYCFVTVNLGDIINDLNKLNTEFTVTAFVEVDGIKYTSEQETTYSVASMIAHYMDVLEIAEVEHLYDYLANSGLI